MVSSPGSDLEELGKRERLQTYAVTMRREVAPFADLVSLYRLWRLLARLRPTITNFGTPKAGLLGGIAAKLAAVPCRIYTIHGLRLETATGVKRLLLSATEKIACRCANRVICVSPSLRRRVIGLGLTTPERTLVLAQGSCDGVNVEHYGPSAANQSAASSLRTTLHLPSGVPVVGFVGRFTRDKGMAELITAFDTLKTRIADLRLLLVGDFEDGDPVPQATRARIEHDPSIIQAGFVADAAPYYHLMDVLALPTYREGFPGAPLEAAAAGKAVVTTNATGAIDSVVDGVTGLIIPAGDSRALAEAMERLLGDSELRQRMGAAGRERVIREFRQESVVDALIDEYRSLLESHTGTAEHPTAQHGWRLFVKRTLDLAVALVGLFVLSPLLLLTGFLVLITMGRPVLFRQRRPGKNQKPFMLVKFRTMRHQADASGKALPDAMRLTGLGRLLRATSLDELPQLWNVLRGDLSMVGPRPLLMAYLDRYTPDQLRRHNVLPGITGWAQIHGRNAITWPEKFQLDLWYVDHWSLGLDLQILCKTLWQVIKRDGISQQGHATMPEFTGACSKTNSRSAR